MERDRAADERPSLVLVHAAWTDGSCWSRTLAALRAPGMRCQAAQLSLSSVEDDVAAVERTIERLTGPVILVGHAYSSAVISSVRHERVIGLVHVAGLTPANKETVAEVFYRLPLHPKAPALEPDAHGYVWLPDAAFSEAFAQDASPEDHALLAAVQRPIAAACIETPVGHPLWVDLPSWYIVAERDRMIPPDTQHYLASRMNAHIRSLSSGHAPMITAPSPLAALLLEAAEKLR
ncbi:alpha/beta fold hydrolase [Actinacidiphila glaucinigra]|uniref:alpha/beta fold hydrolase n=1 Tax=Actinacidiphila glaucinigra TaxID=235986 RepID=UPI003714F649